MSKDKAPRSHKKPKRQPDKGLVMVYTGGGKGKTTAAMGTVLRALGYGMKVAIVQFIKGSWLSGEEQALKKMKNCRFHKMGEGFTWDTKDFERDRQKAEEGWVLAKKYIQDKTTKLVVLDEINCCLDYGFLDLNDVMNVMKKKPRMKHVLLTGRGAPPKLIQIADLVTQMKCVKHPYDKGIWAQKGIDF
jgi:cob(I)alamin adenosyltransferase